jgi:hypothetical protein
MPKIAYQDVRTADNQASADRQAVVAIADRICQEYNRAGYALTLRGLYYQFVARDLFPASRRFLRVGLDQWRLAEPGDPAATPNATPNYKWLGDVLNDARLAGQIDWRHLTDQTRGAAVPAFWDDAPAIVATTADAYTVDRRATQPRRIEVWVEKDALQPIISRPCNRLDVTSFACKGYVSASAMWAASRRHLDYLRADQGITILHLGDHDPSGIDMTRDITDRLHLFLEHDAAAEGLPYPDDVAEDGRPYFEVQRIALTMEQIRQYDPPPNPAKLSDARASRYVREYGAESWELDALDPPVLDALVTDHIEALTDDDAYQAQFAVEERERAKIRRITTRWPALERHWSDVTDLLDQLAAEEDGD